MYISSTKKKSGTMSISLKKITVTEAVVESLKERIRTSEFGPGDKLPSEQSLLKEYGVSRLTLREALARLSAAPVGPRISTGASDF